MVAGVEDQLLGYFSSAIVLASLQLLFWLAATSILQMFI